MELHRSRTTLTNFHALQWIWGKSEPCQCLPYHTKVMISFPMWHWSQNSPLASASIYHDLWIMDWNVSEHKGVESSSSFFCFSFSLMFWSGCNSVSFITIEAQAALNIVLIPSSQAYMWLTQCFIELHKFLYFCGESHWVLYIVLCTICHTCHIHETLKFTHIP